MLPFLISERFWRRQKREVKKGSKDRFIGIVNEGGFGT